MRMSAQGPAQSTARKQPIFSWDIKKARPWDLAATCAAAVIGAFAVAAVPDGSPVRLALVAPAILFAPGYLAVQAVEVRKRQGPFHAALAVGLSLPIVGLLALLTATFPGGMTPWTIVATVTLTCLALAVLALWRRVRVPTAKPVFAVQPPA